MGHEDVEASIDQVLERAVSRERLFLSARSGLTPGLGWGEGERLLPTQQRPQVGEHRRHLGVLGPVHVRRQQRSPAGWATAHGLQIR
jgi:hypothetical protein